MFLHIQTPEDRLRAWREIRYQSYDTEEDLLAQFSSVPLEARYIDYYTPASWPNVFEIVSEGMFCLSGLTLVIAATLHYKKFITEEEMTFLVISNNIDGTTGIVLESQGKIYNFTSGTTVSMDYVKENSVVFDKYIININKIFS